MHNDQKKNNQVIHRMNTGELDETYAVISIRAQISYGKTQQECHYQYITGHNPEQRSSKKNRTLMRGGGDFKVIK